MINESLKDFIWALRTYDEGSGPAAGWYVAYDDLQKCANLLEQLSTEGRDLKASLEFLLNLSVPGDQDWEGYMVAVRNECRRTLASASGRQKP